MIVRQKLAHLKREYFYKTRIHRHRIHRTVDCIRNSFMKSMYQPVIKKKLFNYA